MNLHKRIDSWLHDFLDEHGYMLMRKTNPKYHIGRRLKLMRSYGTDLILDVGANTGQYAMLMREMGYAGEIVSFEPMRAAYASLLENSNHDPTWICRDFALGSVNTELDIHISENSVSSSILPMLSEHEKYAPKSHVAGRERIRVERMDALPEWPSWKSKNGIWVKIDVQGFEDHVLDGASGCLGDIAAIQIELSLRPLYSQQLTIIPLMQRLADLGFDPVAFEPGFSDKDSGEFLQVDGIFRNRRMH